MEPKVEERYRSKQLRSEEWRLMMTAWDGIRYKRSFIKAHPRNIYCSLVALDQARIENERIRATLRVELLNADNMVLAMSQELSAARAELAAMRERERWIPVGERLPDGEGYFEVVLNGNYVADCHCFFVHNAFSYFDGKFPVGWYPISTNTRIDNVTHWRPLPAPPAQEVE